MLQKVEKLSQVALQERMRDISDNFLLQLNVRVTWLYCHILMRTEINIDRLTLIKSGYARQASKVNTKK